MNAKKCPFEGVIVSTSLYGAEAWGMRIVEIRKVNVLEMKCFWMFGLSVTNGYRLKSEGAYESCMVLKRNRRLERIREY